MQNLVIFFILFSSFFCPAQATSTQVNALSFNIRYNTPNDGENAWPHRKAHVAHLIQFHQVPVIGLQEATLGQLGDLKALLPEYDWLGRARDDGKTDSLGEYAAIMYDRTKLKVLDQGAFWCSLTPDKPSKGWDSSLPRNVNWAQFKHHSAGQFYLFNAHFDHVGAQARAECASLLRQKVDELVANNHPVIVMGDFNSVPADVPYKRLTNNSEYSKVLFDAKLVSKLAPYGPDFTFTNFAITATDDDPIDYVFVSEDIKVNRFGVLSESLNGRLPSDHYPILVDISLSK